jgi:hypothetical protein
MSDLTIHLPHDGKRGVELFNSGEYFKCHDAFEEVWKKTSGEERHYYQGLIQIAVALYKIREEQNWRGAVSLFKTGIGHLDGVDMAHVELDIERLKTESAEILERLEEIGPERIGEINQSEFPKLHFSKSA